MGCKVGLVIYCILQAIAFLFVLVGTPIDQFREKNVGYFSTKGCLTFWGYKTKCYGTKYEIRPGTLFANCKGRKSRFEAAEAFAIISIAVYLVAMILGFVQLCCCSCLRWVCLVLNILGVATACICWACMASEFNNNRIDTTTPGSYCFKLKAAGFMKYGAGFGLYVTAWCLCLVNIVFLMLPC